MQANGVKQDASSVRLENDRMAVEIAPAIGGRMTSLVSRGEAGEWLWRNPSLPLRPVPPGSGYDSNFWGGVDEVIPCDMPEVVGGVAYPDHGELWTQALTVEREGAGMLLRGRLPLLDFAYERRMQLVPGEAELEVDYRLTNVGSLPRAFLWKLHAALRVAPGDRILCPAVRANVLDPAWSRRATPAAFDWPHCGGMDRSLVPAPDGTSDFLALTGLSAGRIGLLREDAGLELHIEFDRAVFPCCCFFASYGKFLGHYAVVLEPATSASPTVAGDPSAARLEPGEDLVTTVRYRVGIAGTASAAETE